MATPLQISRQFQRELHAHQEGIDRLHRATRQAEERTYASSSVYGSRLINEGLGCVTEAIEEKRSRIAAGSTGEFAAHVRLLEGVPSSTLALLTLKTAIDVVFAPRQQVPGIRYGAAYGEVVRQLGIRVYDECLLSQFAAAEPEAFNRTRIHHNKGYSYKVAKYRATMRRISHEALKWPSGHRVKIGSWLMDRLCSATGWFITTRTTTSRTKQLTLLQPAPELVSSIDAILRAAEALSACRWPMLCEPNDWEPSLEGPPGGYLTNELRSGSASALIRGLSAAKASQSFPRVASPQEGRGETAAPLDSSDDEGNDTGTQAITPRPGVPSLAIPVRFLNSLQKVAYQINNEVLKVARVCRDSRLSIGSFRQSDPLPLPHKPDWDSASEEERVAYKKARVLVEEENSLLGQRNYQTSEIMHIAEMYADEESFWFPWSFDFRGRVYPLTHHLTPQGTDFARALLVSAYSGPADREALAFQVATTFGLSKETLAARQQWVDDNLQLIQAIAHDPLGTISRWQGADEPWQFLAACIEFTACCIDKTRSWSNLFVGFDATCSGLQHLSALTRDLGAARLVNVAPTDRPSDAYATVAEASKQYMPEEYHHLITRKLTKRVVMCLPYGLTRTSARDYLRQALPKNHGVPLKDLVDAVYKRAIPEVLPGPMRARKWIQDVVNQVAHATGRPVAFTSPSGFPVILDKRVYPIEQVDTRLMGKRVRVTVADFDARQAPLNTRKITIGSVPNLIHSFDAALFHIAFADWDRPVSLVHDCIATLSCDFAWTVDHIRESFARMYEEDQLQRWADQLGVPVDPEVMIGTLDPSLIRESNYLFC